MSGKSNKGPMSSRYVPNGRKRRLTSLRVKVPDKNLIPFQALKRQRTSDSDSNTPLNMAHMPGSPNDTNNHKMSLGVSTKVGFNNLTKKPGQGKKLVIKNRRGTLCFGFGMGVKHLTPE